MNNEEYSGITFRVCCPICSTDRIKSNSKMGFRDTFTLMCECINGHQFELYKQPNEKSQKIGYYLSVSCDEQDVREDKKLTKLLSDAEQAGKDFVDSCKIDPEILRKPFDI